MARHWLIFSGNIFVESVEQKPLLSWREKSTNSEGAHKGQQQVLAQLE
jgi:hypothetical protein